MLSAGAELPDVLLQQLRVGGRLVAARGTLPVMSAQLVTRTGGNDLQYHQITCFPKTALPCAMPLPENSSTF